MRTIWQNAIQLKTVSRHAFAVAAGLLLAAPALAQGATNSPWENAVGVLQTAFTSTIARGLSLVAIVVSGLTSGNSGGGKGPQLKADARSDDGKGEWR